MDVRCRANRACIASLSPAAMRLIRMTSDEVSPAPAAIADTAAAADFGRFNASIMENSPLLTSRFRKASFGGAVPAFFSCKQRNQRIGREVKHCFSGIRNPNSGVGAKRGIPRRDDKRERVDRYWSAVSLNASRACTHKIAIGDSDGSMSALVHFADSVGHFPRSEKCH